MKGKVKGHWLTWGLARPFTMGEGKTLFAAKMAGLLRERQSFFHMGLFAFLRKVSERKTEMSSLLTPHMLPRRAGEAYQLRANPLWCVFPIFIPKVFGVLGVFFQKYP